MSPPFILGIAPMAVALAASPALASEDDPDHEACLARASAASVDDCGAVEVVDAAGAPIANAKVTWSDIKASPEVVNQHPGAVWGWSGFTNVRGRVFAKELAVGPGALEIEAPSALGGRCAGVVRRRLKGKATPRPTRVVLKMLPVARSEVRGRVVDAAGNSLASARVRLLSVNWKSAKGEECSVSPEIEATSAADGAFALTSVPNGKATVVVKHPTHAEREVELSVPGTPPDLVLDAGTTWTGRVLRPDGSVLDHCQISFGMRHPPMLREVACSPAGFTLERLPSGRGRFHVSTKSKNFDAQLGARVLEIDVQIQQQGRQQQDIRWPSGQMIAGRVVTSDGVPVANAALFAVPARTAGLKDGSASGVWTRAGSDGRFAFRDLLSSGEWIVRLQAKGFRETATKVKTGSTDVVVTVVAKGGAQ
jgi:hypothetical protein